MLKPKQFQRLDIHFLYTLCALFLLYGCALAKNNNAIPSDCLQIDIDELMSSPIPFDGKKICTRGFYYNSGQPVVVSTEGMNRGDYYDRALILDWEHARIESFISSLKEGDFVEVIGTLSVPSECWEADSNTDCFPFSRPIDIKLDEISKLT